MKHSRFTPPPGMAHVMRLATGESFYTARRGAPADSLIAVVIRESGLHASPELWESLRAEIRAGKKTLELRGFAILKD